MLEVRGVHTYYGESHVLHGVDLTLSAGTVGVLLGRNGVGKTTLIRTIAGQTPPRAGEVLYRGEALHKLAAHEIARRGIGLVPQGRRVYPSLTVEENLTVHARPGGDWNLQAVYDVFPRLFERRHNRGNQLSGGEQQMLAIGRALMTNPTLMLLDEPTEGLAPLLVQEVGRVLKQLKDKGLTLLVVEQNLSLALSIADIVYVMGKGTLVFTGTVDEFRQAEDIKRRYLSV